MIEMPLRLLPVAAVALATSAATAEPGWTPAAQSAVRVISTPSAGSPRDAGVEVRLNTGWKTYWRYPGDAGIPPRFDFSGSRNVAAIDVAWPAPKRFVAGGVTSIGYGDGVVFPLRVTPQDPARPVELALHLSYAVCEQVCVPVEVSTSATLPVATLRTASFASSAPSPDGTAAHLAAFAARVPQRVALGSSAPMALVAMRVDRTVSPWQVIVDARAPQGTDLFVEGPDDRWALPVPSPLPDGDGGMRRFAVALDGLPPEAKPAGARLTFTLVAPNGAAIETVAAVDD